MKFLSVLYTWMLCCAVMLVCDSSLQAQHLSLDPFKGNTRLPSSEIHGITEDRHGNKWVASDAGLIRITGSTVKVYTKKDGLASDVVLKIYLDSAGRVWTAGPAGVLSLIIDGKAMPVKANAVIRQLQPVLNGVGNMITGTDGCLYVIFQEGGGAVYKISADYATAEKVDEKSGFSFSLLAGKAFSEKQKQELADRIMKASISKDALDNMSPWTFEKSLLMSRCIFKAEDASFYIAAGKTVLHCTSSGEIESYALPDVIYVISSVGGTLVAGVANGGMYILKQGMAFMQNNAVAKTSITSFLHDKEGNFWVATLEKGLFVARYPGLTVGYNGEVAVARILSGVGAAQLLLQNNSIVSFDGSLNQRFVPIEDRITDAILTTESDTGQELYLTLSGLVKRNNNGYTFIDKAYYANHILLADGSILCWGGRNLLWYRKGYPPVKRICPEKILCISRLSGAAVLAGSFSTGLWKIKLNHELTIENLTGQGRINCIAMTGANMFAAGTNEEGIQVVDSTGHLLKTYKSLPSRIQALAVNNASLYAGTKDGLFVIDMEQQTVAGFNNSNLLPFDEIRELVLKDSLLYMAGRNNAVSLSVYALAHYRSLLNIEVKGATVSNHYLPLSALKNLDYQTGFFTVDIDNYSYRASANTVYHFIVKNAANEMVISDSSASQAIRFTLEPGNYQVSIYATDKALGTVSNSVFFPVSIALPFFKRWWFMLTLFLLVAGVIYMATAMIIRRIKARELQKRNLVLTIASLEARALQGQMNPHFVFNAVNSVQDFILSNKAEEAHLYLSQFAKLIRMVLEHNRKKNVSVEDEVQLLKLYVAMEEQRLKDTVTLTITMPAGFDPENILLPSMLLQPLVENAIWHGLTHKQGDKIIHITFEAQDEQLTVLIEDNGAGIETEKEKHASVGMEIVKERVRLAFAEEPKFDYFKMENRSNGGVAVKIVLPLQTEY